MSKDSARLSSFFKAKRDVELLDQFDLSAVPAHVAIIMDGNGRWASKRALPRIAGHRAGVKAIRETIAAAIELGIRVLTIYTFSSENWNRPADEVSGLMGLFVDVLERETDTLDKLGVKVLIIGTPEGVPEKTMAAFRRSEERTAANTTMTLAVALNYGGRAEITRATRAIAEDVAAGRMAPDEVDDALIESYLFTAGIPDPDLVIRTSGEMRISNFLLWQIAYSELWITSVLWPDFARHDLLRAVVDYQRRNRRFGGR